MFAQDQEIEIIKLDVVPDELKIDESLSKFLYVIDLKAEFDNKYKSKVETAKKICTKKILEQFLS